MYILSVASEAGRGHHVDSYSSQRTLPGGTVERSASEWEKVVTNWPIGNALKTHISGQPGPDHS